MSDAISKFITSFVESTKQDRYFTLMKNTKRRNDMLWDLLHDGRHLDLSKFQRVPHKNISSVHALLNQCGAKGKAIILAPHDELDGFEAELSFCLERFLGKSEDVAVYFPLQNIGYYENHEGQVYVFSATP